MLFRRISLPTQIFMALFFAFGVGSVIQNLTILFSHYLPTDLVPYQAEINYGAQVLLNICQFISTLFLNGLKMVVVPLLAAAILSGLTSMHAQQAAGAPYTKILGQNPQLGRLGFLTAVFYLLSGLLAILVGLASINYFEPGIIDGKPGRAALGLAANTKAILAGVAGKELGDLWNVFLKLIPENPLQAATTGDMLGVVMFCLLLGWALNQLNEPAQRHTHAIFWKGLYEAMAKITGWVMKFAPIGVFAIVTQTVAKTGFGSILPLLKFALAVIAGLLTHALITLPFILKFVARVSPWAHFKAMTPALITAFGTSSSNATLPVTIDCIEKRAKVPRRVSGFVLPIGANINTDGTALYECAAALFIAQAYGLNLSFEVQFMVVSLALVTSLGVAGIPSASLVAIALILNAIGLPAEGIGLILVVDRVLDMCRTTVNVLGDSVATVFVARLVGEAGVLGETALGKKD